MSDSFRSKDTLTVGETSYTIFRLDAVIGAIPEAARLPFCLKVLLENLLRTEDGLVVTKDDVEALARWSPTAEPDREIDFTPSRVMLQDFTGVPAVVDLAAMRDAMAALGGDPNKINPLQPVELVVDHSVQVDDFGGPGAFANNTRLEYERNQERYVFLRWGQDAFDNFRVVPPETGIIHQVNLEHLARVVFVKEGKDGQLPSAYPDTLVGTDSHTTMINGLGVLGWGVGGIEAEAAMLGQPVSMLIPQVVGFKLHGRLPEGATATDLVLTVTQMLRKEGVVGKFVEFYGPGLADLPLADRATIANMAPEYGATCGIFPVDAETLRFMRTTGRSEERVALTEAYYKAQGMFHTADTEPAAYSRTLELDLSTVEPSLAGPARPQDRVRLGDVKRVFNEALPNLLAKGKTGKPLSTIDMVRSIGEGLPDARAPHEPVGPTLQDVGAEASHEVTERTAKKLRHGSVVIASITSCTNTSNPSVMLAAGLLAKKAVARGLQRKGHVKSSLSPGSKVVTDYLKEAGVMEPLEQLGFHLAGYGCMTCIAAGTPVLLANGTSRRIERMPGAGGALVLAPTDGGRLGVAAQAEAFEQGVRDCVALVLQDGRELVCTPDHRVKCDDSRWLRADELEPGRDRVVVGLEAPSDDRGSDEAGYVLTAGEMRFEMDDPHQRLQALAFARVVGHLLGDGSISAGQGRVNIGQALDREAVLNDVEMLTDKRPAASRYDDRKWVVVLPKELTDAIASLPGVRVGRRIDQVPTLPAFVLDERCPVAVVREFLAGTFGADGHAPVLRRYGPKPTDGTLTPPALSRTARPEHVGQLESVTRDVLRLLGRCGVVTDGATVSNYPTRRSESSYPAAVDGEPRVEVRLQLADGLSFVERVGYRYCVDKSLRASAAAVYWRTVATVHRQRQELSARLREMRRASPRPAFRAARAAAVAELTSRETVVFPHYSLLEGHDRFDRLPEPAGRKFRPLHRESCGFPSPPELFAELGVRDWFAPLSARDEADQSKRYCAHKEATTLPTFSLRVLARRRVGERRVFDLSVRGLNSFVAGTVAVHNCIGNSGPLPEAVSNEISESQLVVASVLSGNRNFEGRVHSEVRANFLGSPPLVVAYAIAGRVDIDMTKDPLAHDSDGNPVMLADVWPTPAEVQAAMDKSIRRDMYEHSYADVFKGDEYWNGLNVPEGSRFAWNDASTYVKNPPYFEGITLTPAPVRDIRGARALAVLGDSITTDHISPAGAIKADGPAGKYLLSMGVESKDFNSYGSRRGNHEVMVRGTFANVRLKNKLVPGVEGGVTRHLPDGQQMSIFDAAMKYIDEGVPTIILAGKEYGSGSSRDWAAKGPRLQGVRAVIAESFERIHRSNLVGMGILPLQFKPGYGEDTLHLSGEEVFDIEGLAEVLGGSFKGGRDLTVKATSPDGKERTFPVTLRIDTPQEVLYYQHGGILQYVLRQLCRAK